MPWKHIKKQDCPDLNELGNVQADEKNACAVCGETADLRRCLTCGFVSCCESHLSHDSEHFQNTAHPFIKPHKCDYDWLWCYKCQAYLD